jgi:hypothetical protein
LKVASVSDKELAERGFPWRVDIRMTLDELPGVREIYSWFRERGCAFVQHSHVIRRQDDEPEELLRYYFVELTDAQAFRTSWGGEISAGPTRETAAAPD